MNIQSLSVSVSVAVYFRKRSRSADKRIPGNRLSFGGDVNDFAEAVVKQLSLGARFQIGTLAGGDKNISMFVENYAAPEVHTVVIIGYCPENNLKVFNFGFIC